MKQNKIKGSAILVVIFSSIAFFIYVMSVYSEAEHFNIIQNKYEKNINKKLAKGKEIYTFQHLSI